MKAYILLADGFEEIEALTPLDVLRRAGVETLTASMNEDLTVTGTHGIKVIADIHASDVNGKDARLIIIPGGMPGAANIDDSEYTDKILEDTYSSGGYLAAICAAPLVLGHRGYLEGKFATCFPGFENTLRGAEISTAPVVSDGRIVTARGMGCALHFSLELVRLLVSRERADEIRTAIQTPFTNSPDNTDIIPEEKSEKSHTHINISAFDTSSERDEDIAEEISEYEDIIFSILDDLKLKVSVKSITKNPRFISFELVPERGVRVPKILAAAPNLELALGRRTRVTAIASRSSIFVEVARRTPTVLHLGDLMKSDEFESHTSDTAVILGLDSTASPIVKDLAKFPHLLIGGADGSGKSSFLNSLIITMLAKSSPKELQLILIDPKGCEFNAYLGISELILPPIEKPYVAFAALKWANTEMERRYKLFYEKGVKNLDDYKEKSSESLAKIIIIIDELSFLTKLDKKLTQELLTPLLAKSRAAGIHLILSSGAVNTDTFSGEMLANTPTRIAFRLTSFSDSKLILSQGGGERLLGCGDMLYRAAGEAVPMRIQAPFIDTKNILSVLINLKNAEQTEFSISSRKTILELAKELEPKKSGIEQEEEIDGQFIDAVNLAIEEGFVSTSLIQRRLGISYTKAASFIERIKELGIADGGDALGKYKMLISEGELQKILLSYSEDCKRLFIPLEKERLLERATRYAIEREKFTIKELRDFLDVSIVEVANCLVRMKNLEFIKRADEPSTYEAVISAGKFREYLRLRKLREIQEREPFPFRDDEEALSAIALILSVKRVNIPLFRNMLGFDYEKADEYIKKFIDCGILKPSKTPCVYELAMSEKEIKALLFDEE